MCKTRKKIISTGTSIYKEVSPKGLDGNVKGMDCSIKCSICSKIIVDQSAFHACISDGENTIYYMQGNFCMHGCITIVQVFQSHNLFKCLLMVLFVYTVPCLNKHMRSSNKLKKQLVHRLTSNMVKSPNTATEQPTGSTLVAHAKSPAVTVKLQSEW